MFVITKTSFIILFLCISCAYCIAESANSCQRREDGEIDCDTDPEAKYRPPPKTAIHWMDGMKVGHEENVQLSTGQVLEMHTASLKPLVLEIPEFLSESECSHLISIAEKNGLKDSVTTRHASGGSLRGIKLMDVNNDKILSLNEMMLTLEDSFDMYLDESDILDMYHALDMDGNDDGDISQSELQRTNPQALSMYLMQYAKENPVKLSRFSKQVWLFPDQSSDKTFIDIQKRVHEVTKLPMILIKKSDFQVVKYGMGGHYNAHQDSDKKGETICCTRLHTVNCRICRLMTVLFYLNDVEEGGGTAFPLAGNSTYNEHELRLSHHINLQRHCSDANLVVQPRKGKAVIWYNHLPDLMTGWVGDLDQYTWHGGCPVIRGNKWIANFWIKYTDDVSESLR